MTAPLVSVVVPTRNRAGYLDVALASLASQRLEGSYELLIVDDCSEDRTPTVVRESGVRYVRAERPSGLNAARNVGVRETTAPLVTFVDDDVYAPPGWLQAIVDGAERFPAAEAFGGPIRARLEGRTPSSCGREDPPITTLDLGRKDVEASMVWGSNMTIRRRALEWIGPFDESVAVGSGDEEDWLRSLRAAGGRIVYLAAAGLDHRRAAADARFLALTAAAYQRGRAARAGDQRRGVAPGLAPELRVLAGCAWHGVRFACPQGPIMAAHSAGRVVQALIHSRAR
ncbi:MAG: glycosyltransferase [Actinomycetota bacterium]|nr:glycosyltransferase [Actinomycetota bacterium]